MNKQEINKALQKDFVEALSTSAQTAKEANLPEHTSTMNGLFRSAAAAGRRAAPQWRQQQVRNAGSSAGPEYNHFKVPHVDKKHIQLGEVMGTMMWLWIFYRAKEDGVALLGLQHPWDAHGDHGHGHDDDHHDHGHGHHGLHWTKEPGMKPELE